MPWTRRHKVAFAGSAVFGVAVAAILVVGLGPPGVLLTHVQTCRLGASIGTYTIWSPLALVNIPDLSNVSVGSSAWNYTMTSGSLTVGALGPALSGFGYGLTLTTAGIRAVFADVNWTFYRTQNVSVIGSTANPCTQQYVAVNPGHASGCEYAGIIPIPDNSTDFTQPHFWNGTQGLMPIYGGLGCPGATPGTSAWFDTSFHASQTGTGIPFRLDLCNWSGTYPLEMIDPAQVPVVVTAPYSGGHISASGYLTWQGSDISTPDFWFSTAHYNLPPGWVWELAPVGPSTSTLDPSLLLPNLIAFERLACT